MDLVALVLGSAGVWTAALVANRSANGRWGSITGPALAAIGPNRYAAAAGMLLLSAVVVAAAALAGDRWAPTGEGDPTGPVADGRPGQEARCTSSASASAGAWSRWS